MKIFFLGTGTSQGIPIIGSDDPVCLSSDSKDKRLRSCIAVSWDKETYIVDCGPDFRYQMLRSGIVAITAILFTHEHADHTAGLDDIRPFFFKMGAVPFYATKSVFNSLEKRFDYILNDENKYPGAPSIIKNSISDKPFNINSHNIVPIHALHGKLPVVGYRFGDFTYLTDVKTIDKENTALVKGTKTLVINALRIEEHPTHFNLQEALDFIKKVSPQKTYLSHISHKLGFHEEVSKSLPENVFLAYDTLEIEV